MGARAAAATAAAAAAAAAAAGNAALQGFIKPHYNTLIVSSDPLELIQKMRDFQGVAGRGGRPVRVGLIQACIYTYPPCLACLPSSPGPCLPVGVPNNICT